MSPRTRRRHPSQVGVDAAGTEAAACEESKTLVAQAGMKIVVCFGDSITHGFGMPGNQSYPALLERLLGIRVINAGVDGDTAEGALVRVESDVLRYAPDLVIIEFGANDYLAGLDGAAATRNLEQAVAKIKGSGAEAVVLSLGPEFWGEEYEAALARVAADHNCRFMTGLLAGIADNPLMTLDGVHPNVPGYIVIARKVADFLAQSGLVGGA